MRLAVVLLASFLLFGVVAACGGSSPGDANPLVGGASGGPSSGLATEEPLPTEDVAAEAPALAVKVTKKPGTVARGANATVAIKTAKNASCDIDVEYESGRGTAKGLVDKKANSKGEITWKWKVGIGTHKGAVPIYITCTLGARSGNAETRLIVK